MRFVKTKFDDAETLAILIKRVAEEEGRAEEVSITSNVLQEDGFSANPAFHSYLAYDSDSQVVGFSFYYYMYSGWHGRRILFLEDLFILPEHRGRGYGSLFFQKMSQVADTEGMKLAWEVNRDNFNQRVFFESKGAVNRTHKVSFFMGGEALVRQANQYLDHRVEINQQEEDDHKINESMDQ